MCVLCVGTDTEIRSSSGILSVVAYIKYLPLTPYPMKACYEISRYFNDLYSIPLSELLEKHTAAAKCHSIMHEAINVNNNSLLLRAD